MFFEKYEAFEKGRLEEDPSLTWFQDQMAFLDDVAIPLAAKLVQCEKFGKTAHWALECVQNNRKEWALQGPTLVVKLKNGYFAHMDESKEEG